MNLERFEALIGDIMLNYIKNLNILIVGIGGVGGYTLESLVRSGVENITIIDFDKIDSSNLNRQILTNTENIGALKTDEAIKRSKLINPNVNIKTLDLFLDESNINDFNLDAYDYVVDTCDTLKTKELLINRCIENNIKIISSMGTAKKLDASKLEMTTLDKTSYDPLAKSLRRIINKRYHKKIKVISSKEVPIKINELGSCSYVPAVAGLLITNYIINDALKGRND